MSDRVDLPGCPVPRGPDATFQAGLPAQGLPEINPVSRTHLPVARPVAGPTVANEFDARPITAARPRENIHPPEIGRGSANIQKVGSLRFPFHSWTSKRLSAST